MQDDTDLRTRCAFADAIRLSVAPEDSSVGLGSGAPIARDDGVRLVQSLRTEIRHPAALAFADFLLGRFKSAEERVPTFRGDDLAYKSSDLVHSKIIPLLFALRLIPDGAAQAQRDELRQALIDQTEDCLSDSTPDVKEAVSAMLNAALAGELGGFQSGDQALILIALAVADIAKATPEESQSIDSAFELFGQAETRSKESGSSVLDALIYLLRGRAHLRRHGGDRAEDLDEAVKSIDYGLNGIESAVNAKRRAIASMELGTAYSEKVSGNREQNLRTAIECHERALEVFDEVNTPTRWAHTHINLGNVYQWLTSGDVAENHRLAAQNYHLALRVLDRETSPLAWMVATMNLASLLLWQTDGGRSSNIERAIELYESLSVALEGEGNEYDRAFINFNLGIAHVERLKGPRVPNLETATRFIETALEAMTLSVSPHQHGVWKLNLAAAYQHIFTYDQSRVEDLEQAIKLGNECLEIEELKADNRNSARLHNNLGVAYKDLATYRDPQMWDAAESFLIRANEMMDTVDGSIEFQQPLVELADLHLRKRQWAQAIEYCTAARTYIEATSLGEAMTEGARHQVFGRISEISAIAAYSELQLGKPEAAIAELERGRARRMSEAMNVDIQLTSRAGVDSVSASADPLRDLPHDKTLVMIVSTVIGGAAILLRHPEGSDCETRVCWLEQLTQFKIEALLNGLGQGATGWIPNYRLAFDGDSGGERQVLQRWEATGRTAASSAYLSWNGVIDSQCEELWQSAIGPIDDALSTWGVAQDSDVVLLPPGSLSLLPLHAACGRVAEGRRLCFGDLWSVSYAPSLSILLSSLKRLAERAGTPRSLLAIADPEQGTHDETSLPGSKSELDFLERLFEGEHRVLLTGQQATHASVMDALADANYIHASCHGTYDWDEPKRSGLALSNGERLTLSDLTSGAELSKNRLFFASACETGFKDLERSPDEFVGVSAGLMQAGAPNVVGTLWPVFDDSAFLLCRQFYKALFKKGSPTFDNPSRALRHAQAWLRSVTFGSLAEEFGTIDVEGTSYINLTSGSRAAVFSKRLNVLAPDEDLDTQDAGSIPDRLNDPALKRPFYIPMGAAEDRPYERPHDWAAYFVYGP